jgi:hypothetical protein
MPVPRFLARRAAEENTEFAEMNLTDHAGDRLTHGKTARG